MNQTPPPRLATAQALARRILHLQAQQFYLAQDDPPPPEGDPDWLEQQDPNRVEEDIYSATEDLLLLLAPDDYRHWHRITYGPDPTDDAFYRQRLAHLQQDLGLP